MQTGKWTAGRGPGGGIDAECILESSPVMSAVASRKALELGVKWVYSALKDYNEKYKPDLTKSTVTLINELTNSKYVFIEGSTK